MTRLTEKRKLGNTDLDIPPIVFGTSSLGNLYEALPDETKREILAEMFRSVEPPVALDSAGLYGAGMALEVMGRGFRQLGVKPDEVIVSNKLGWLRTPLTRAGPTFEPKVWANLTHDARQQISHDGILECYEQGCELLGQEYRPQMVSVHDPDEYLAAAASHREQKERRRQIVEAYEALGELKSQGRVRAVGIGAKDWQVIRDIASSAELDWVMFACSLTVMHHPPELIMFVEALADAGVAIINSAVFHGGFLTGGGFFDYREVSRDNEDDRRLFEWRERFYGVCEKFDISPAAACVQFGLSAPGVVSVALNTTKPERVAQNVALIQKDVPSGFWSAMKDAGLIARDYPYC
jgi:D-threo-aldose 1-dehydrogenase